MSEDRASPQYDPPPGIVALGAQVEIELVAHDGESERLIFDIVPEEAADFDAGFLAVTTPLARAIVGRAAGADVPYRMGDVVRVRILAVSRSQRRAEASAAAERDAATRDAVQRAKTEETIQLALTFSSKWGDYDPEPLEPYTEPPAEPSLPNSPPDAAEAEQL